LPENEAQLPHRAVFHLNQPVLLCPEDRLLVRLESHDVSQVRFSVSPDCRPVVDKVAVSGTLQQTLQSLAAGQSVADLLPDERVALQAAWYRYRTPLKQYAESVKRLRQAIAECHSGLALTMISQPLPSREIRPSRVLPRGDWQNTSGPAVVPNTPHFLAGYTASPVRRLNRLDLAEWLTSPSNPLTPRHYVNRTWKHFFGAGLSNVLDDLGNQGEWPSHPQLLDWLACEFRRNWDRKHITRLIVTSNTYRQQAASRPDLQERDPWNRLLAQQSARRLEAEIIRDNALAISGLLLDDWVGGPSVFPFQPPGHYANLQFPNRKYESDRDGRQYRRGVYMHWQRTFLHPMLTNFDAPSRDECAADRIISNSPQQALTLLNDPVFVEASRALATRLIDERPAADFATRLEYAWQLALCRPPDPDEIQSLHELFDRQLEWYRQHPEDAAAFHQTGRFPVGQRDPVQLAALAQVCRVLLNLHETITRY
jgi:hypothetical protein